MTVTDHPHDRDHLHLVTDDEDTGLGRTPPHDITAEQAVLGAMLLTQQAILDVAATGLDGPDFYRPAHETIYNTILDLYGTSRPTDPITVADELRDRRQLTKTGGTAYLHDLITAVPTTANAAHYARIVTRTARRRRWAETARRIAHHAHNHTGDIDTLAAEELTRLGQPFNTGPAGPVAVDIDTFLNIDDPDHAWLIPDLLERQDRLIVTAGEGHGKSTLLRQLAIQAAAGLHPFTHQPITPLRVLLVDLENSERQTRRKIRPLRRLVPTLDADRLHIICKPDGLDLTTNHDETWLDQLVTHHRADILITGPIYKLAAGNPNAEEDAKPASAALDRIRSRNDCAVILEAHSAKAPPGAKKRPIEPFGWSGWLRWPEFGIHLGENGTISHWRGQRDERDFPTLLTRGPHWPWNASPDDNELRWHQIRNAIWQAGKRLSVREIEQRTGISKSTVDRVLGAYAMQYGALIHKIETEGRS